MTFHSFALRTSPIFIAVALPLTIVSCSGTDTPSGDAGMGNTPSAGGSSGTASAGAGMTAKGGSSGSTATGGAGTGGSGGAGTGGTAGANGGRGGAGAGGKAGSSTGGGGAGGVTGGMGGIGGAAGGIGGALGGLGGATGGLGGATGGSGGGGPFALTSPTHMNDAKFASKFTCDGGTGTQQGKLGQGVNPELDWTGVPAGTKSLAMTFIDTTLGEDNMLGQHWAIWNVPWDAASGKVSTFPEALPMTLTGDLMAAKQSGKFLTPCAQSLTGGMDDQYVFTLYALSTATLDVTGGTTVKAAITALRAAEAQTLGKATLKGHAGLMGK